MLKGLVARLLSNPATDNDPGAGAADFAELDSIAPLSHEAKAPTSIPLSTGPGQQQGASFICREAILDRNQHVTGYEFLLRKGARQRTPDRTAIRRAHDGVLLHGLAAMDINRLLGHRFAIADIIPESFCNPLIDQLPKKGMVLRLAASDLARQAQEVVEHALRHIKEAGFGLALAGDTDPVRLSGTLKWVDYLCLDATILIPETITRAKQLIASHNPGIRLMATGLESHEDFDACYRLGFDFFQGPFVTRKELWQQQKPDGARIHICNLLNHLRRDAETRELVNTLKRDAALAYRLLRYINSPGGGLVHRVASLDQAIVVLGREKLHRWLSLMLFTAGPPDPQMWLLKENSLTRARLMELLGQSRFSMTEQEQLFMVGIFSLLDLILGQPMEEALRHLSLPEPVHEALAGRDSPYLPYFRLAVACESFDQEGISAAATSCGLGIDRVNRLHVEALVWCQDIQEADSPASGAYAHDPAP